MQIIGLCGYTGVGKDEAAKYLVGKHGYTRVAFADAMREDLYKLNPIINTDESGWTTYTLRDVVDSQGWDKAKREEPEIRRLLQVYGTEVGREGFGDDVWIDRAIAKIRQHAKVVVTDVRFENEVTALRKLGATIVQIIRPGHGAINGHASEQLDYAKVADYFIGNDGDIQRYQQRLSSLLDILKSPTPTDPELVNE